VKTHVLPSGDSDTSHRVVCAHLVNHFGEKYYEDTSASKMVYHCACFVEVLLQVSRLDVFSIVDTILTYFTVVRNDVNKLDLFFWKMFCEE
jgi:hypothetical protein